MKNFAGYHARGLAWLGSVIAFPRLRDMSVQIPPRILGINNGIQDFFLVITILNIYAKPLKWLGGHYFIFWPNPWPLSALSLYCLCDVIMHAVCNNLDQALLRRNCSGEAWTITLLIVETKSFTAFFFLRWFPHFSTRHWSTDPGKGTTKWPPTDHFLTKLGSQNIFLSALEFSEIFLLSEELYPAWKDRFLTTCRPCSFSSSIHSVRPPKVRRRLELVL